VVVKVWWLRWRSRVVAKVEGIDRLFTVLTETKSRPVEYYYYDQLGLWGGGRGAGRRSREKGRE
jgi:hypothetical protein